MQRWKSTRGNCFPKFCPDAVGGVAFSIYEQCSSLIRFDGSLSVEKVCPCFGHAFVKKWFACNFNFEKINQEERKVIEIFENYFF